MSSCTEVVAAELSGVSGKVIGSRGSAELVEQAVNALCSRRCGRIPVSDIITSSGNT